MRKAEASHRISESLNHRTMATDVISKNRGLFCPRIIRYLFENTPFRGRRELEFWANCRVRGMYQCGNRPGRKWRRGVRILHLMAHD